MKIRLNGYLKKPNYLLFECTQNCKQANKKFITTNKTVMLHRYIKRQLEWNSFYWRHSLGQIYWERRNGKSNLESKINVRPLHFKVTFTFSSCRVDRYVRMFLIGSYLNKNFVSFHLFFSMFKTVSP
jgi:hypothetical protein